MQICFEKVRTPWGLIRDQNVSNKEVKRYREDPKNSLHLKATPLETVGVIGGAFGVIGLMTSFIKGSKLGKWIGSILAAIGLGVVGNLFLTKVDSSKVIAYEETKKAKRSGVVPDTETKAIALYNSSAISSNKVRSREKVTYLLGSLLDSLFKEARNKLKEFSEGNFIQWLSDLDLYPVLKMFLDATTAGPVNEALKMLLKVYLEEEVRQEVPEINFHHETGWQFESGPGTYNEVVLPSNDNSSRENCLKILGLDPKSNPNNEEIKRAYRSLARRWHPDVSKGDKRKAEEKFKEITRAYAILMRKNV